jgi:hypothetical protein
MKIVVANTQSVARPHKRKQLIKEITRELGDKVKRLAFSPPANQLALAAMLIITTSRSGGTTWTAATCGRTNSSEKPITSLLDHEAPKRGSTRAYLS